MNYQPLPDPLFESAYALVQAGRHAEARRTLLTLLQQVPNHVEALVLMGYLSRPAEARRYFMQALQLDPYHAQAQRGLLNIEQRQQRRLTGILVAGVPFVALAIGLFFFIGLNLFGGKNDANEPTVQALVSSATPTRRPANNIPRTATLATDGFASPTPIDWLLATPNQFVPPSPTVIAEGPTSTETATLSSETPTTTATETTTATPTSTQGGIVSPTPTSTPSETKPLLTGINPTSTPTATSTLTPTTTQTATDTPPIVGQPATDTSTPTSTPTTTATSTSTATLDTTETATATVTASAAVPDTATATSTPTATSTETETATPTPTDAMVTSTPTSTSAPAYTIIDNSYDVLALINQARCTNGLNPVILNPLLNNAATIHSIDMAVNNFVDHVGSDGSNVGDRVTAQNYPWVFLGENIAGGPTSVTAAFGSWGTEYILDPNMREMGLGHVSNPDSDLDHYWTLVMASRGTDPITCADIGL
ncbi:MAG: hypothetical protein HY862_05780 [Chloroflexi bacterium]|nr:hypothetical protein [Chloroflexota bacterium]